MKGGVGGFKALADGKMNKMNLNESKNLMEENDDVLTASTKSSGFCSPNSVHSH